MDTEWREKYVPSSHPPTHPTHGLQQRIQTASFFSTQSTHPPTHSLTHRVLEVWGKREDDFGGNEEAYNDYVEEREDLSK